MSGLASIVTGLGSLRSILSSLKWVVTSIRKLFQKDPVKEFEKKLEEHDEAVKKAKSEHDTTGLFR